jgi:hypothetical protein
LKIEIPTSPQVTTTVNNNNSVSSRPPLHTKLGQHYAKSPIAVNAERERRKSEARHQILKEIVSGRRPLLCVRVIQCIDNSRTGYFPFIPRHRRPTCKRLHWMMSIANFGIDRLIR